MKMAIIRIKGISKMIRLVWLICAEIPKFWLDNYNGLSSIAIVQHSGINGYYYKANKMYTTAFRLIYTTSLMVQFHSFDISFFAKYYTNYGIFLKMV